MWSALSLWLPLLAATAQALLPRGQLYIYGQHGSKPQDQHHAISAEATRLIIASKLGVSQYHDVGIISDETLLAVNEFGGAQKLFESSEPRSPVALLMGYSGDGLDTSAYTTASIIEMPSISKSEELLGALSLQKQGRHSRSPAQEAERMREGHALVTDDSTIRIYPSTSELDRDAYSLGRKGYEVLILISPRTPATSHYGSYTLPSSTILSKRQSEEPMEDFPTFSSTSENDTVSPLASNATGPLRGILPACYTSKSACESTTRNCTGHGSCTLAYTQKDNAGSDKGTACFSCSCKASVRQNKDGTKKTTVWSGPACQKKDVVAPFWLIAGFTVLMVFLISWGVGMIWSMGEEELPSVIGAGVSGVPRK